MNDQPETLRKSRRAPPQVRQAAILDAALAEFARHGFADARVEDIARGAGVSKGTVYLYYPTKQALFEALVHRDIRPRAEMMWGFLDSYDGPLEPALMRIMALLGGVIDAGQVPVYPRLLLAEAGRFPELVAFYRREVIGVTLKALAGLLARAMERGEITREDPEILAHLFIAPGLKAVLWSLVIAPDKADSLPAGTYLAAHVRLFLKGLKNA